MPGKKMNYFREKKAVVEDDQLPFKVRLKKELNHSFFTSKAHKISFPSAHRTRTSTSVSITKVTTFVSLFYLCFCFRPFPCYPIIPTKLTTPTTNKEIIAPPTAHVLLGLWNLRYRSINHLLLRIRQASHTWNNIMI